MELGIAPTLSLSDGCGLLQGPPRAGKAPEGPHRLPPILPSRMASRLRLCRSPFPGAADMQQWSQQGQPASAFAASTGRRPPQRCNRARRRRGNPIPSTRPPQRAHASLRPFHIPLFTFHTAHAIRLHSCRLTHSCPQQSHQTQHPSLFFLSIPEQQHACAAQASPSQTFHTSDHCNTSLQHPNMHSARGIAAFGRSETLAQARARTQP
jgi:hypothetical protein